MTDVSHCKCIAVDLSEENDRLIDEIERLRKQLEMSEQRFAALKEAYDKNRRRNIQLYGSKALGEKK
jgi:chaperonin cofactor prefoldin